MSLNAQKYLVAVLSLIFLAALIVVGRQERLLRAQELGAHADALASGPLSPDLARGKEALAKYSCNACHGTNVAGGVKNFNAQTGGMVNGLRMVGESYTKQELVKKILDGVPVVERADPTGPRPPLAMPPYRGTIPDQEVEDLVNYLFSLQKGVKKPKSEAW